MDRATPHTTELRYLDLESGHENLVFQPAIAPFPHLTLSPDGRRLVFPLIERNGQELMMIEHWR
jgi:hypothetical protein